jgi:DNA-directed RNA polymerase specialized sigma24 family protein
LSSHERPDLWLRRTLVNSSRSRSRRRQAEQRAAAKYGGSLVVSMPTPSHELWSAVRRLPRRQREVVALVYGEDRTVVDAARILGCSEETARTHQRRALARLASELGEDHDDSH